MFFFYFSAFRNGRTYLHGFQFLRTRSLGPLAFMICKVHCLSSQTDISVALNLYPVYDVRLIVSYRSYNLNVILVRILYETYISPFLDPHGSAKILYFGSKSSMLRVLCISGLN